MLYTTLKTAVLAPIPRVNIKTVTAVNPGFLPKRSYSEQHVLKQKLSIVGKVMSRTPKTCAFRTRGPHRAQV